MIKALLSGLVGAVALNVLHETARQFIKNAPRVDITGERALARTIDAARGIPPKNLEDLYVPTLVGDVISNSLYYSLVGAGGRDKALAMGAALGAVAGVGAVYLPEELGLGKNPTRRTKQTAAMTVGWYTVGGVAAGLCYQLLSDKSKEETD